MAQQLQCSWKAMCHQDLYGFIAELVRPSVDVCTDQHSIPPISQTVSSPTYLIHLTHINALLCLNYLELNFEL